MIGRRLALPCLAALVFASSSARTEPAKDAPPARKDRHALLVAVSYYEHLPESKHLKGPANDAVLMYRLLTEKLQFSPDQITLLSEQAGKDKGKDYFPTKANIKREFDRLAKVAKPGDRVMIHLGGHGSQQPEQPNYPDPKPDGLSVTFLPRDIGKWNDSIGSVENAIIDHEMGEWLKPIRDTKASLWITFDSCHSGTMMRGGDEKEVMRDIDPLQVLGIPKKAMDDAREKGRQREMPPMTDNGTAHGLLTYTVVMVITEAMEKSKEPITYGELARRIQAQYVAWGRTFPTPLIEGDDKDREILGDKVWPGRSSMFLSSKDGLKVNAGAVHGLTKNSILSVKPPPGKGDKQLGYVVLTEVRPFDSDVEPCDEKGKSARAEFPEGAACEKYFIDVGDQKLKVSVDPLDEKINPKPIPEALRKKLADLVRKLDGPESVVAFQEKSDKADWLVRAWGDEGKEVVLVPAAGWPGGQDPASIPAFGPAPINDKLGDWLKDALGRVARAEALKKMAAGGDLAGGDGGVKIKVEPLRRKQKSDNGSIPLSWPAPNLSLYDGDLLALRIGNPGRVPIDVTILYIDSACGIECLYPVNGENNRLRPGDSIPVKFTASKSIGTDQVVIIAVKGQGQNVDFSSLAQPSLDLAMKKAGTRGEELKEALDSPLGKLLKKGLYGQDSKEGTRGLKRDEVDDHVMLLIPMQIDPKKRPPEPKPEK